MTISTENITAITKASDGLPLAIRSTMLHTAIAIIASSQVPLESESPNPDDRDSIDNYIAELSEIIPISISEINRYRMGFDAVNSAMRNNFKMLQLTCSKDVTPLVEHGNYFERITSVDVSLPKVVRDILNSPERCNQLWSVIGPLLTGAHLNIAK